MFLDADLIPLENFDTLFNYNVPLLCLCGTGLPSGGLFIYDPKEYDFEELVNIYKDHCWNDEQQLTMMWFTNAMLTNNWISIYGPTPFNERI